MNALRALIVGGTGTISSAVTELLARTGWDVYVLNRGHRLDILPNNVTIITADINDEAAVKEKLSGLEFDTVCEFIGFVPEQIERDYRLFAGKTKQYIFISSASAYNKPAAGYIITEGTTLANPYWEYSRSKIACEELLMRLYREEGFPVTIVRPSHTYDKRHIPVAVHGKKGFWQVLDRMIKGKPVIIHGDGSSLWTLTYNTDFAQGFTGLMSNPHAIGEAFHITSGETLTWDQIYSTIASALGVKLNACHVSTDMLCAVDPGYDLRGGLTGDKAVSVVFDNSKLRRAVPSFAPAVNFDRGVRLALEYILSEPEECCPEDPEFDSWCDRVAKAAESFRFN